MPDSGPKEPIMGHSRNSWQSPQLSASKHFSFQELFCFPVKIEVWHLSAIPFTAWLMWEGIYVGKKASHIPSQGLRDSPFPELWGGYSNTRWMTTSELPHCSCLSYIFLKKIKPAIFSQWWCTLHPPWNNPHQVFIYYILSLHPPSQGVEGCI